MLRFTFIGSLVTDNPLITVSPDVGSRYPHIILIVVLLPAPLGPSNPKISPLPMVKETPLTASCLPKVLTKFCTVTSTVRPSFGKWIGPVLLVLSTESCTKNAPSYKMQKIDMFHR